MLAIVASPTRAPCETPPGIAVPGVGRHPAVGVAQCQYGWLLEPRIMRHPGPAKHAGSEAISPTRWWAHGHPGVPVGQPGRGIRKTGPSSYCFRVSSRNQPGERSMDNLKIIGRVATIAVAALLAASVQAGVGPGSPAKRNTPSTARPSACRWRRFSRRTTLVRRRSAVSDPGARAGETAAGKPHAQGENRRADHRNRGRRTSAFRPGRSAATRRGRCCTCARATASSSR
jgi:hypothetical protein